MPLPRYHALVLLSILAFLGLSPNACAEDGVLFHASFEGNPDAKSVGDGRGKLVGKSVYTTGHRGQGIRLSPGTKLLYSMEKNVNLKAGTVMFWFKPEWTRNGYGRMLFFRNGVIDAYRFNNQKYGGIGVIQVRVQAGGKVLRSKQTADLTPGEWAHLAIVWDEKKGFSLYVNGNARISENFTWQGSARAWQKKFILQATLKPDTPVGKTGVLDEYKIYDHALSADAIRAAYMIPSPVVAATTAAPKKQPVFLASFENRTRARLGADDLPGIVGVRVAYETGQAGQGVIIRRYAYDQKPSLTYALGALNKQGTLSFHFKPFWSVGDGKAHELLYLSTANKKISLAVNSKGKLVLRFGNDPANLLTVPATFKKDKWQHFVIRWNSASKQYSLSIDEAMNKKTFAKLDAAFFSGAWSLCVGAFTADNYTGNSADGVFDELAIYDEIISPAALRPQRGTANTQTEITIQPNAKRGEIPFLVPSLKDKLFFYFPGKQQQKFPLPVATAGAKKYFATPCAATTSGAFSFWGRLDENTVGSRTLAKIKTATATYRFIYDPRTKRVGLVVRSGEKVKTLQSLYVINPGEWNLYAVSWQGGELSFNINGTWQGAVTFAPPTAEWKALALSQTDSVVDLCAWDKPLSEAAQIRLFNHAVGGEYARREPSSREQKLWNLDTADRLRSANREKICLSGLWRFAPSARGNLLPPPDQGIYYSRLPGRWISSAYYSIFNAQGKRQPTINGKKPKRIFRGWYTRQIEIPADFRGQRIYLTTNYMGANAARVYVNNRLVKTFSERNRNAQGEVRRVYADLTAFNQAASIKVDIFIYFNEYFDRWTAGDASLLDLALEKRGTVFSKGTRLRTSVSKRQMRVLTTLANPTQKTRSVQVVARIFDSAGQLVHTSPATRVELSGQREQAVDFSFPWLAPRLWSHESPTLYTLRLRINDAAGGLLDESYAQSFGFRDFVIDGSNFKLNGKKLHLFYCSNSNGLWSRYSQFYGSQRKETFAAVRALKENGYNTIGVSFEWSASGKSLGRTPHYQKNLLDAADALGMYVVLWAPPLDQFTDRARYREAVRHFVTAWGNHPSVIFYLTTFNTCGYQWAEQPSMVDNLTYVPARRKKERALALASDAVVRSLDPTRELWHNCSGNLTKLYTTMHYMSFGLPLQEREDWPSRWNATRKTAFMASELGFPYFGQFYDFDFPKLAGIMLYAENAARYLGDTAYQLAKSPAPMQKGGDYGCFEKDGKLRPEFLAIKKIFTKRHLRAWRGYGVSGIGIFAETTCSFQRNFTNHTQLISFANLKTWGIKPDRMYMEHRFHYLDKPTEHFKLLKKALTPILVMISGKVGNFNEKDHAYFAEENIDKQAIVINDTRQPLPLAITVEFRDPAGTVSQTKQVKTTIPVGETYKFPTRFVAPKVTDRTEYKIHLRAERAGVLVGEDDFVVQVFPREKLPPLAGIGLYDPRGLTKKLLQKAGVKFKVIREASDLDGLRSLIIGREALGVTPLPLLKSIEDKGRIARGLRVLIFEQTAANLGNLIFEATSQRYVFIRDAAHPLLVGLQAADFVNWRGSSDLIEAYSTPTPESETCPHYPYAKWKWGNGGIVSSWVIRKPQYAAFQPILDCGYDLSNSPLLEYARGQGRVVMCQLDVTRRYGVDPAATRLTNNLLRYLAAPLPPAPRKAVYFGGDNAVWQTLQAGRADCSRIKNLTEATAAEVLILAPNSPAALKNAKDALEKFVAEGGTVLYFQVGKNSSATLSWTPFAVPTRTESAFHARLTSSPTSSSLLRGLGAGDLYWRTNKTIQVFEKQTALTSPPVIATTQHGKGRFVFCGIDPAQFAPPPYKFKGKKPYISFADKEVQQKAIRIVNTLLDNLGVALPGGSLFGNERYQDNQKSAQDTTIKLPHWKFKLDPNNLGEQQKWTSPEFDDSTWKEIFAPKEWEAQGYTTAAATSVTADKSKKAKPYDGYAWYRVSVFIPKAWLQAKLTLQIGSIDDFDWTYCNGVQIGHTGEDTPRYWQARRNYPIPNATIRFGEKNTFAIRVLDLRGSGGITRSPVQIRVRNNSGVSTGDNVSPYVRNLSRYDMNAFHKW